MAQTVETWDGKGVLWHGRKKIKAGDPLPADLNADVRKSLKAKGQIKEVVVDGDTASSAVTAARDEEAKAKELDEANIAAKTAEADVKGLDIEKLTEAIQTARSLRVEASKAVDDAEAVQARIKKLTKAVQTAKGASTKAQNAYAADPDNEELATKADTAETAVTAAEDELNSAGEVPDIEARGADLAEAETGVTAAEDELRNAHTAAETAVRLRVAADVLANG